MNGATDSDVFARAYDEDRIVVTFNVEDFEELARQCNLHAGLILIDRGSIPRAQQWQLVRQAWALVLAEHQAGRDMVNRVLHLGLTGDYRFQTLP